MIIHSVFGNFCLYFFAFLHFLTRLVKYTTDVEHNPIYSLMNYYKVSFPTTTTDQETELLQPLTSQRAEDMSTWFWCCFVGGEDVVTLDWRYSITHLFLIVYYTSCVLWQQAFKSCIIVLKYVARVHLFAPLAVERGFPASAPLAV